MISPPSGDKSASGSLLGGGIICGAQVRTSPVQNCRSVSITDYGAHRTMPCLTSLPNRIPPLWDHYSLRKLHLNPDTVFPSLHSRSPGEILGLCKLVHASCVKGLGSIQLEAPLPTLSGVGRPCKLPASPSQRPSVGLDPPSNAEWTTWGHRLPLLTIAISSQALVILMN